MPGWRSPRPVRPSAHPLARPRRSGWPADVPLPPLYRLTPPGGHEPTAQGELARDRALSLVEAALVAADEPLTAKRLAQAAGLADAATARSLVKRLQALYDRDGTAFQVEEVAGGYQLLTRSEYHSWLVRLRRGGKDVKLSAAARETLAIIAYRQPITRADVEAIRGVQCSEVLQQLMEKGLIRIAGRDDSLGRPMLYGTTKKFLQVFGLKNLHELPQVGDLGSPSSSNLKPGEPYDSDV